MAVAAAVAPQAANAATITVNSLSDAVVPVDDGLCTLREAIINANDNAATHDDCAGGLNPDTIDFSVNGTITLAGESLFITDSLTINGPGEASLTIDAEDNSRIFTIDDDALLDVTIRDLTLTNGNAADESIGSGGAIFSAENLTLERVTITNSDSFASGGGVAVEGAIESGAPLLLTIIDSTLTGNTAGCCGGAVETIYTTTSISGSQIDSNDAAYGGGLAFYSSGSVTISDTVITGNDATASGGGLYLYGLYGGSVLIENSTISGNTALETGGGLSVRNLYGALTINDTTISGNEALYSGGAYVSTVLSATLDTVTVSGNTATVGPGGVHLSGLYSATIRDSQITGNQAADAGGALVYLAYQVDIVNTTVAQNIATNYAGGLLLDAAIVNIDLATIAGNSATVQGGNVWVGDAVVDIENSIIADGTSPLGPDIYMALPGGTVDADWSIIETAVTGAGTFNDGGNNSAGPALLGPLQNNGGPTLTMKPQNTSPAVNGGDPAFTPPPNTDQRKFTRPIGRVDMGAVEVNHGTVAIVPPAPIAENAGPLSVTLTRTGGTEGEITINFSTTGGTATSNVDFAATAGSVTFLDGETEKTFDVGIIDDLDPEASEQFTVQITSASAVFAGTPASALVTILDNDTTADLVMAKSVNGSGPFFIGGQATFTIGITNNGPSNAPNVVVTDTVPAGTSFVSATPAQGSCSGTTTITCNLGTLNSGASASISLVVQITTGSGMITNTAVGESDLIDPTPASASATFNVGPADAPTLSEWMLMALAAALVSLAVVKLRP